MEKWKRVTPHTARRSYCTKEFLTDTPTMTMTIMAISGHTTEKEFMKYIKLSQNDHAEKQQNLWAQREVDKKVIPFPKTA